MMRAHEIQHFLRPYDAILQLANKVRGALHMDAPGNSLSRFVQFSNVENEPLNFAIQVLQTKFVARFEISKYEVNGQDFAAGQYAFFRKQGKEEVRLPVSIRLVPENSVVLPSGTIIEIPFQEDDPDDVGGGLSAHNLRRVRDSMSEIFLSDVITNAEKWAFQ